MGIENDKDYRHGENCPLRWPCFDCGLPGGVEHDADDMCRSRDERCNCMTTTTNETAG